MKFLPHIRIRQEQFGAVIFDKEREKFFVVDEVGNDILRAIQSGKSLNEVVEELTQKYEVSREVIERDTSLFVEELRQAGLIEQVD